MVHVFPQNARIGPVPAGSNTETLSSLKRRLSVGTQDSNLSGFCFRSYGRWNKRTPFPLHTPRTTLCRCSSVCLSLLALLQIRLPQRKRQRLQIGWRNSRMLFVVVNYGPMLCHFIASAWFDCACVPDATPNVAIVATFDGKPGSLVFLVPVAPRTLTRRSVHEMYCAFTKYDALAPNCPIEQRVSPGQQATSHQQNRSSKPPCQRVRNSSWSTAETGDTVALFLGRRALQA